MGLVLRGGGQSRVWVRGGRSRERERERGFSAAIRYFESNIFIKLNENIVKENLSIRVFKITKIPAFSTII